MDKTAPWSGFFQFTNRYQQFANIHFGTTRSMPSLQMLGKRVIATGHVPL